MKSLRKFVVVVIAAPLLLLSVVVALLRTLFTITLEFTWDNSTKIYGTMLIWIYKNVADLPSKNHENNT